MALTPAVVCGFDQNESARLDKRPRSVTFCVHHLRQFPQLRPVTARPGIPANPPLSFRRYRAGGLLPGPPPPD
jgi:hypothetical protein